MFSSRGSCLSSFSHYNIFDTHSLMYLSASVVHSEALGYLGCLQFGGIMNKATMKLVYKSSLFWLSLSYEIIGEGFWSGVNLCSHFWEAAGFPILLCAKHARGLCSLHMLTAIRVVSPLMGKKQDFLVILTCIFLMNNN